MSQSKRRQPTKTAAEQLEQINKILSVPQKERKAPVVGPTRAPKHFTEVDK